MNVGLSYAVNYFEKILILNNDVILNEASINEMVKFSKLFDYVTIGMKNFHKTIENNGTGFVDYYLGRAGQNVLSTKNIKFLNFACCIIDKKVLKKIGFLRDDWFFLYWEDVEFSRRFFDKKNNFTYKIVDGFHVLHGSGLTTKKIGAKLQFYYASSSIIYFLTGNNFIIGLYSSIVGSLLRLLKRLLLLELKTSFYIFFGICHGFLKGIYIKCLEK